MSSVYYYGKKGYKIHKWDMWTAIELCGEERNSIHRPCSGVSENENKTLCQNVGTEQKIEIQPVG